ncbi:MAG: DUF4386 domain-containing protein [Intrasporangiaceae bacterium]|nr:DUF4386 domain-containing protein [Intrasporangiaceae bacterium]
MREIEMRTYRSNAIAAGVLFILCSVAAIMSIVPLGAQVVAPVDFARLAANADRVVWTALIEFVWIASGMGIAIAMYPALKKSHPALALGSVIGRVVENAFILIATLCLVALLSVSQQTVAAGSAGMASAMEASTLLLTVREWSVQFIAGIAFAVGSVLYNYVLYRSRLVPRWLSGWGLFAVVCALIATLYAGLTQNFGFTTVNNLLHIPIGLQEMALAIWLIVKGFSTPSPVSAVSRDAHAA